MTMHTINLNITTEQLIHLNKAISETQECTQDALRSKGFEDEYPMLSAQLKALDTFKKAINTTLEGIN